VPKVAPKVTNPPHVSIIVPAHDEAEVIAATVASLAGTSYAPALRRIIVIADNCTDDTAKIARSAGAEVWERQSETERGKGFALRFAIDRLLKDGAPATDAVVVIDADTRVDAQLLDFFAWRLSQGADWIQAYYNSSNPDASWRTRLLTLALSLINGAWLKGQDALGIGVLWRGNGMCMRASALRRQPWQGHGLAEDIEFGWLLRLAKERVQFCSGARVYGDMVSQSGKAADSQRQRWEHGRRIVKRQFRWRIVRAGPVSIARRVVYLVELYMPALSSLAVVVATALLFYCGAAYATFGELQRTTLLDLQLLECGALALYLVTPFVRMGVPIRYLAALVHLPTYALWRAGLMLKRAPTAWVRTPREQSRE
jgi:cellulose synthase/poly-beta-1,6-N-acetylglucosamine synthase-like glycosyltransferase